MVRAAVAERSGRFDKLLSVGETLLHVHSGDATHGSWLVPSVRFAGCPII
jgi:hypothetical protein